MASAEALRDGMARAAAKEAWCRKQGDWDGSEFWANEVENFNAQIARAESDVWTTALVDNRHG